MLRWPRNNQIFVPFVFLSATSRAVEGGRNCAGEGNRYSRQRL